MSGPGQPTDYGHGRWHCLHSMKMVKFKECLNSSRKISGHKKTVLQGDGFDNENKNKKPIILLKLWGSKFSGTDQSYMFAPFEKDHS
jgi:hypothetical protein